ncbi:translocation/assembly module TamB domain-containing protein [Candidatus Erwinia haradaeae]|uniref:Translocation and assembly module subunit TamB n=1 Tax=Candidatus Erwinia haradaeae TaxID=1922217 RepID=A0A451D214_9GAMM|nr:translocation/assembly module TamB domain-containing protein [Candidatus Erwinia haradaeae]VFP79677.1 Translocation and assembly module subunit TamB [Candidatus Erwinia haradaeae]
MTAYKKILLSILICILILSCGILFLIGTNTGTQLILSSIMPYTPSLNIKKAEGTFLNGIDFEGLSFATPKAKFYANKIYLRLHLSSLIKRNLCVTDLILQDVNLFINKCKLPLTINTLYNKKNHRGFIISRPMKFSNIKLYNFHCQTENTIISFTSFLGGLNCQKREITLTPSYMNGLTISLPKSIKGNLLKKNFYNIENLPTHILSTNRKLQELQKLCMQSILPSLIKADLPLTFNLMQLVCERIYFSGNIKIFINQLLIKSYIQNKKLQINYFSINFPKGQLKATGNILFNDTCPINLIIHNYIDSISLKNEKIKIHISGALYDTLKLRLKFSGPVQALINLHIKLSSSNPPIGIYLYCPQLFWYVNNKIKYQAKNVYFLMSGQINHYNISFKAELNGQHITHSILTASCNGDTKTTFINYLRLTTLQGHAELQGKINWDKITNWYGELTFSGLDSAQFYPDLNTSINGKMIVQGSLYKNIYNIKPHINNQFNLRHVKLQLNLTGKILDRQFNIYGSLSCDNANKWYIPGIILQMSNNQIALQGSLNDQINLNINLDAKNLNNINKKIQGKAQGIINIRGARMEPILLTNLKAYDLKWHTMLVDYIHLDGSVHANNKVQNNINLYIKNLKKKKTILKLFQLKASGTLMQHYVQLNVKSMPISGQMSIQGAFNFLEKRWIGTINLSHFFTVLDEWQLITPTTIHYLYKQNIVNIEKNCWNNQNFHICISKVKKSKLYNDIQITVNRLNLIILNTSIHNTNKLSGVLETGYIHLIWNKNELLPSGTISVIGENIKINYNSKEEDIPIFLDKVQFNIELNSKNAQCCCLIKMHNYGTLDTNLKISDLYGKRILSGTINTRDLSISLFNPTLILGENISGIIYSNLQLKGDLKSPQIFGQIHIHHANFESNLIPIKFTRSQIKMNFYGSCSTLKGIIHSAQGDITINGKTQWKQINHWQTRISIIGNKIKIIIPPNIQMDIIPNLLFIATPKLLTIVGHIEIPWANLLIQKIPIHSIQVSSDEVLLDENLKPIKPKLLIIPIHSNITLHIGKNVNLNAIGVKGKIYGDLKIKQDNYNIRLYGKIHILSGNLQAYTQNLIIRKGELYFSGLLTQPSLDIEAIRNPETTSDDVIVGIRLTGRANQPTCEIFSDPEQTQEETLSYLLHGQKLESANNDNYTLTSTLIGWGLSNSKTLTNKISQLFKINHLIIDSIGTGEKKQIQMNANLLPGLQIKYSIGIFDSLDTLTLRYRLFSKLYLEVTSGVDQIIDLLYHFSL